MEVYCVPHLEGDLFLFDLDCVGVEFDAGCVALGFGECSFDVAKD